MHYDQIELINTNEMNFSQPCNPKVGVINGFYPRDKTQVNYLLIINKAISCNSWTLYKSKVVKKAVPHSKP